MDLICRILQYTRDEGNGKALSPPVIDGYTMPQVNHHIGLCGQAGYLNVLPSQNIGKVAPTYKILELTWDGHNYIESQCQ